MTTNDWFLLCGILALNHILSYGTVWFLMREAEKRDRRRAHEIQALTEKLMALANAASLEKHARYREARAKIQATIAKTDASPSYVEPDILSTQRHLAKP